MARGRGGILSTSQYEALPVRSQRTYEKALGVRDLMRDNPRLSFRKAARIARVDTRDVWELAGSAFHRRGRRVVVRDNDRLYMGSPPMPMLTPDGVYDASPGSWRQRSLIGSHWSLMSRARRMSDQRLASELRKFRGTQFRVPDPESGRLLRMPFETDVARFRSFASSPEAGQERIISPRLGQSPFGGGEG